jgi:hypothetical protein
VRLVLVQASADVRGELDRQGITEKLGPDAFFETVEDALDAFAGGATH